MKRFIRLAVVFAVAAAFLPASGTVSAPRTRSDIAFTGQLDVGQAWRIQTGGAVATATESGWFTNFDTGYETGEPTLSVLEDGSIVAQAMTEVVRSTNEGKSWKVVHTAPTGGQTLDPYIHADAETDRIISSQLLGACQMLSISDDAGASWIDAPTQCPSGDHQKLGSGPWADPSGKLYPRAFYTCLNKVIDTACSISYDGGLTWGPQVVVFPGVDPGADRFLADVFPLCGGLEGDPVSGPDGTIYVPREYCGRPFLGVSKDDGLTWSRHWVGEPAEANPVGFGANNPSVYVDPDGTVFYAWTGGDWGHYVAYSKDQGETWSKPLKVSPPNVETTTFPMIIAGKKGRVATAFIGTSVGPSNPGDVGNEAIWHLYLSYSLNALSSNPQWKAARVTTHPIQIGCVGRHGGTASPPCTNGNLLDFNDIAFLKDGRVVMSYTDGCLEKCENADASEERRLAIAVQTRGPSFR